MNMFSLSSKKPKAIDGSDFFGFDQNDKFDEFKFRNRLTFVNQFVFFLDDVRCSKWVKLDWITDVESLFDPFELANYIAVSICVQSNLHK